MNYLLDTDTCIHLMIDREPQRRERILARLAALKDESAARIGGVLRASLEKKGKPIGPLDTLIAAHAVSLSATLITNNVREFSRVPGLHVKNWSRSA